MTAKEIAERLVDVLTERVDGFVAFDMQYPTVEATRDYVSVTVGGCTVWDDEDENDNPEHGETVETALQHAETVIVGLIAMFAVCLPPTTEEVVDADATPAG